MPFYVRTPSGIQTEVNYFTGVGLGLIPTHNRITALGHIGSIGTPPSDVWEGGGVYPFQSSAQTLEILSTSANDTPAGTGARTVLISGLDVNYNTISEILTLNGVTPVPTVKQYLRINTFTTISSGSSGVNAGDITLRVNGAGAVQAVIKSGYGFARSAIYTVPSGFTLFIISLLFSVLSVPGANTPSVKYGITQISSTGNLRIPLEFLVTANGPYRHDTTLGIVVAQKTDFTLRITSASNASEATAALEAILVNNNALL